MTEKQQILRVLLCSLLVVSILLLTACGGEPNNPSNPSDTGSLNGDFKGRLFISGENDPWIMDFSTGRYTPIPGLLWEDNPDYFRKAEFSAYPVAYNGVEFIETIEDCRSNPGLGDYDVCINIRDDQGKVMSTFEMNYETSESARLSRDRQYFAIPLQKINYRPERLTLFTRDGVFIDASDERNVESFDWLPDNRLIYVDDRSIYITPLGSVTAKGNEILTFPDEAGIPGELAVSPDGSQLAFTLRTRSTVWAAYGTTWVLDLDSNNLRQLTNTPEPNDPDITSDDPIIGDPVWSPDGRWIAVIEGFGKTCVGNPCIPTGSSVLYVVPSDGENVMLTTRSDITTSAVLIYSYFDETNDRIDNPEISAKFDVTIRQGGLAWLP